jgi:8-oxo-dGTP pyrophosphatase MutT (NUDIX family)
MASAVNLEPVTAAGGLVYRQNGGRWDVLLIYRNSVWDLPKGTLEVNETIRECALRETAEETGLLRPQIDKKLTKTEHEYWRNEKMFRKTTHWFSMPATGQETFSPQVEEGIAEVEWVELNSAERKLGYENLKEVLAIFRREYSMLP